MYTSGCPKNQKIRWNKIGSPPAAASKKAVLKFLSKSNIVIPPAKTGNANNKRIAVIKTDQTNKGILRRLIIETLMFNIVTIKFIAPNIEESPANRKLIIAKSTAGPDRAKLPERGG